jgi:hypothetical protein
LREPTLGTLRQHLFSQLISPGSPMKTKRNALRSAFFFARIFVVIGIIANFSGAEAASPNFTTLIGKHVVGYQGWFSCPQDGSGLGWRHWFSSNRPDPHDLAIDMWPDLSEFTPADLCATGLTLRSGKPAYLYSAENPKIVARHFQWMRDYGIDGVALQRFDSEFRVPPTVAFVNKVLDNVRAGAEASGRGFFIMYDVSGKDPDVVGRVSRDWDQLTQTKHLTDSPSYMRHKGKPVVGIWGIGVKDRPITVDQANALIAFFRHAKIPATIVGGVPAGWRTLDGDSHPERQWAAVYRSLDVISPWTVGRFQSEAQADRFVSQRVVPDMAEAKRDHIDYMPVIFPGFSWHNLQHGKAPLNMIPRECGHFYQRLAQKAIQAGASMIYSAMFDEVNEGTALYKVVTQPADTPANAELVTLDDGGCKVASDWYLHLAGQVTQALHNGK